MTIKYAVSAKSQDENFLVEIKSIGMIELSRINLTSSVKRYIFQRLKQIWIIHHEDREVVYQAGKDMIRRVFYFLLIYCLLPKALAVTAAPTDRIRPKIGLALSGGGAKGFAHIGVIQALEELEVPIDCISGVSMGAVVGGLYACGYMPAEMETLIQSVDWQDMFTDRISRRYLSMERKRQHERYIGSIPIYEKNIHLPAGLIHGQKISKFLTRLTIPVHHINDFSQLPIPFSCVATDLANGEPVALNHGVLAEAMRASMSIPTIFTPVILDSLLLVDGGVARNLPVIDAFDLGADIVIAVDVGSSLKSMTELHTIIDIIDQTIEFRKSASTAAQRQLADFLIIPNLTGFDAMSLDASDSLIILGRKAVASMAPKLTNLVDSFKQIPEFQYKRPTLPKNEDLFYIEQIRIIGLNKISERAARARFGVKPHTRVKSETIEKNVEKLFGSQFFDRVSYQITPSRHGKIITVWVIEKHPSLLRFGLNYNNENHASILIDAAFQNSLIPGSNLSVGVKLSDHSRYDLKYSFHPGLLRQLGVRFRACYVSEDVKLYRQKKSSMLGLADYQDAFSEIFIGTIFSSRLEFGLNIRYNQVSVKTTVPPEEFPHSDGNFLAISNRIRLDTLDKAYFPTNGQRVSVEFQHADKRLGNSGYSFSRWYADVCLYYPVTDKLTKSYGFYLGSSSGADLPFGYHYSLGDLSRSVVEGGTINPFFGLESNELVGNHVAACYLTAQYEVMPKKFLILSGNLGKTTYKRSDLIDMDLYIAGFALSAGIDTPFGPIFVGAMSGTRRKFLGYLQIGYRF
ncbi:MAG: hypothetical protein B6244_00945 [Candidatus Cloacimonetes bacterium 4572_55]|nr:MAG: hypothetical protein B6244_00945 [Candidatus Cloacimonetes bacterium 4572_55]